MNFQIKLTPTKIHVRSNILVLLLFTFVLFTGCENNDVVGVVTRANIIGSVNLYDEGTNPLPKNGMTVTVVGSSPLISTVTDANGSFVLPDMPFGTYTLSFEKAGFGTYKMTGVAHKNTGSSTVVAPSPSLGQLSTTTISGLTCTSGLSNVKLTVTITPVPTNQVARYIRVFYSKNAGVSFYNYTNYSEVYKHMSNPADLELGIKALMEMGFSSGDIVYARVYGDSFWSNDYDNVVSGKREFPNLNSTTLTTVSFVVP